MSVEIVAANFLSSHLAGKILDKVSGEFYDKIILRWTKSRAEEFFRTFCMLVEDDLKNKPNDYVPVFLDLILSDEIKSEILFEAYRSVCMTKSKKFGPRIIGLITAQLILENAQANDMEESICYAAENMSDDELLLFSSYYKENKEKAVPKNTTHKDRHANVYTGDALEVNHGYEQVDSGSMFGRESKISITPTNLYEELGPWAKKLESAGFLHTEVREYLWSYEADDERHIHQDGNVREISFWVCFSYASEELVRLIDRANF